MGNTITANVNLDHELYHQQEAIEAGKSLTGKAIVEVQEELDPTNLTLEVNGKEKTFTSGSDDSTKFDKHCFFRADVELHKAEETIQPNTYVFPFSIPLPKSLPSSRSFEQDDRNGSFSIVYSLKLKTKTAGKFPNKRPFLVISMPPEEKPIPLLLQPKPTSMEELGIDQGAGPIFMGAHVPNTHVSRGSQLEVSLACRNESTCKLERALVTLEEEYYWTTKGTGGHQKHVLVKKRDLETVTGIRLMAHKTEDAVLQAKAEEESIARRMFQDLRSPRSTMKIDVPTSTKESYTGLVLQISHYLKFTVVPECQTNPLCYPSIKIPVRIGSAPPQKNDEAIKQTSDSSHVSERARVRFPLVTAAKDSIVVGRNAGILDSEDSFTRPVPSPASDEPTLSDFLEHLAASINDFDFISDQLKDLEWAIFFASLNPTEFGSAISHVNSAFAQPFVAALLAKNFGGDFTCAHAAAAIKNCSHVFRSTMVEGLLAYCTDLGENNLLIRQELSDFEQIIVALHALDGEEEQNNRESEARKAAKPKDEALPAYAVKPEKKDICIGMVDHDGTIQLFACVKRVVQDDEFEEFGPQAYRTIMAKFQERRFLVRLKNGFWKEASNKDKIEYVGVAFDHFNEMAIKQREYAAAAAEKKMSDKKAGINGPSWQQALDSNSGSDWTLAVTIHSYASAMANDLSQSNLNEDGALGPQSNDICFDKSRHPGNVALLKAVRRTIKVYPSAEWSPPVYKSIRGLLQGTRCFVQVGDGEWREAIQAERRDHMERYFVAEKRRPTKPVATNRKSKLDPAKYQSRPTADNRRRRNSKSPSKYGAAPRKSKSVGQMPPIVKHPSKSKSTVPKSPTPLSPGHSSRSASGRSKSPSKYRSMSRRASGEPGRPVPARQRSTDGTLSPTKKNSGRGHDSFVGPGFKGASDTESPRPRVRRPSNGAKGVTSAHDQGSEKPFSVLSPVTKRRSSMSKMTTGEMNLNDSGPVRSPSSSTHRRSRSSSRSNHRKSSARMIAVDGGIADPDPGDGSFRSSHRPAKRNSTRQIAKRGMRHPRDMDVCYGSEDHPGSLDLDRAIRKALDECQGQPWSSAVYKVIRGHLQGKRFYFRKNRDSPWEEADAAVRLSRMKARFEVKRMEFQKR